jgi:hypothetical protein
MKMLIGREGMNDAQLVHHGKRRRVRERELAGFRR